MMKMTVSNQKGLKKYIHPKKSPFDPKYNPAHSTKFAKELTQIAKKHSLTYGKNLFLYSDLFHSLMTIDHLILTAHGILLIDEVKELKNIEVLDESWWKESKTNKLIPSYLKELQRKKEALSCLLNLQLSLPETFNIQAFVVSSTAFIEGIETPETIRQKITSFLSFSHHTPSNASKLIQSMEDCLNAEHFRAVESKMEQFYPDFHFNQYSILGKSELQDPTHRTNQIVNDFLYDNLPNAILLLRYPVHVEGVRNKPIDYLIISEKGILIINYILGGGKIEALKSFNYWIRTDGNEKLKMPNYIQTSILQGKYLASKLPFPTPVEYSIVGITPIDLNLSDSSFVLDEHLAHNLDRYLKKHPNILTRDQILEIAYALTQK